MTFIDRRSAAKGNPASPFGRGPLAGDILFALVIAGVSALLAWQVVPEVFDGQLIESDNYMRLVRVSQLVETGDWYDNSIPRSNAPYGEELHWTRPLDVILLGATAPLLPFLSFPESLHLAGVFLSPLLLVLICFAVAWSILPLAGGGVRYYAMIALLAQPGVVGYALPGRPDHHPLLFLIFVLAFGSGYRWLTRPFSRGLALGTGALFAFGLWVGVEFLLPLALILGTGAVLWILEGEELGHKNLWLSLGLLGGVALALALEHAPSAWSSVEYDRISAPHFLMALLAVSFWWSVLRGERGWLTSAGLRGRALFAAAGGVVAMGIQRLAFPGFFRGPEAEIDPRLWPIWRDLIDETQPLIRSFGIADIGTFISYLGPVLFCFPFLAWVLMRDRGKPTWGAWLLVALSLLILTPIAVANARFVTYPETLFVIVIASILARALPRIETAVPGRGKVAARVGTSVALIAGCLWVGVVFTASAGQTGKDVRDLSRRVADVCPISSLTGSLADPGGLGERPLTILAHLDYGPELLYRTRHRVVATPYQRNADGILDAFAILAGSDLSRSKRLLLDRGVELVLVCPLHSWIYGADATGGSAAPSLHDRLLAGEEPEWLERVAVPEHVAGEFRLFTVTSGDLEAPALERS